MKDFIHSLQHPRVRQLAWICFSDPLIADFSSLAGDLQGKVTAPAFQLHDARRNWLRALDRTPAPLLDYLAQHCSSPRLGLLFESYWHFFLREDPDTTLVANNVPVRAQGRTLGEFDVIYYCHQRRTHVHLELALKFFMATATAPEPKNSLSYWLGPNSRDRLDIKWARMASHQLALVYAPESREILNEFGVDDFVQEAAVKGWLFHHSQTIPIHPAIHSEHPKGIWQTRSEFLESEDPTQWRYLSKPHWLGDWDDSDPLAEKPLRLATERPIMVLTNSGQRRMIAPDNWPATIS